MVIPFLSGATLFLASYLLGSLPTGYLIGKYTAGIDIREHGSGSTGATNALRTLGVKAGIVVLLLDALKGMAAIALARGAFFLDPELVPVGARDWFTLLAGLGAVIGHGKSIFLNFSGGKSVATSLGILLVISPLVALGTLGSFLLVLAFSRTVSLGSLVGAIVVNFLMLLLARPLPYLLFSLLAGTYVIVRHLSNIRRLLAGTEPRLGQKIQES